MTLDAEKIARHFLNIKPNDRTNKNWGTDSEVPSIWDLSPEVYINGVMCTLDFDYDMAYLLEVCERFPLRVSHLMVYSTPFLFKWCDHEPYPFFERIPHLPIYVEFVTWVDDIRRSRYPL